MSALTPLQNQPQTLHGSSSHAVLLVHGLGGGPYEVQRLAEGLHFLGLTTCTVLLPGHGLPGRRMPPSQWPQWFEAIAAAFDELAARFARVDLVGFSTGAPLVLRLAQERQVPGRLVLLSPFLRVFRPRFSPVPTEQLLKAVPFLTAVPRRRPPLQEAALRLQVERCAGYRTFSLSSTRSALELIALVEPRLNALTTPTLIVQGRHDTVVDPKGAALLEAGLGGPKHLLLVDSDHLVTLDKSAPVVLEAVQRFVLAP
jgi:carboxylesterase